MNRLWQKLFDPKSAFLVGTQKPASSCETSWNLQLFGWNEVQYLDGHPTSEVVIVTCGKSYFQVPFEPRKKQSTNHLRSHLGYLWEWLNRTKLDPHSHSRRSTGCFLNLGTKSSVPKCYPPKHDHISPPNRFQPEHHRLKRWQKAWDRFSRSQQGKKNKKLQTQQQNHPTYTKSCKSWQIETEGIHILFQSACF